MRSGPLLRGSFALALLGVWLIVCPNLVHDPGLAQILAWLGFVALLQAGPVLVAPRADLFSPVGYFGVLGAFGTISSIVYLADAGELRLPILGSVAPEDDLAAAYRTVVALALCVVCYYVGYYSRIGVRARRWFPRVAGLVWQRGRMLVLCVLVTAAFVGAYVAFQISVGTSVFAVLEQAAGRATWHSDDTLSWMLRGVQLGFIPVLLLIVHVLSSGTRTKTTILAAAALLVVMMALVSRLGGRGMWASALLTALALFHYFRRRIPVPVFAAVYFGGVVLANILFQYRAVNENQRVFSTTSEIVSRPSSVLLAHEAERMRFETLAVVMRHFPENEPYLLGRSWVPLLVAPIPRWLWPEKVQYVADQDNRLVYRIAGVPAPTPFVGVLYANLSWIGIILGMLAYGVFHRGLYEWLRETPRDKNVVILYLLILFHFSPTALGVSGALQYVLPVWVMVRLASKRGAPVTALATA